ncbi:MAG TPA: hypothetical protein VNJ54_14920 [Plantibacter sp.]|uniref:hypothetical protein n=1 Tax=unclassified Plantibacter TaxID=2624265 RepID=UPI002C05FCD6|nr:hypothetical protein [Plantibacter sp.]
MIEERERSGEQSDDALVDRRQLAARDTCPGGEVVDRLFDHPPRETGLQPGEAGREEVQGVRVAE